MENRKRHVFAIRLLVAWRSYWPAICHKYGYAFKPFTNGVLNQNQMASMRPYVHYNRTLYVDTVALTIRRFLQPCEIIFVSGGDTDDSGRRDM